MRKSADRNEKTMISVNTLFCHRMSNIRVKVSNEVFLLTSPLKLLNKILALTVLNEIFALIICQRVKLWLFLSLRYLVTSPAFLPFLFPSLNHPLVTLSRRCDARKRQTMVVTCDRHVTSALQLNSLRLNTDHVTRPEYINFSTDNSAQQSF